MLSKHGSWEPRANGFRLLPKDKVLLASLLNSCQVQKLQQVQLREILFLVDIINQKLREYLSRCHI